jgi:hypothetical protein
LDRAVKSEEPETKLRCLAMAEGLDLVLSPTFKDHTLALSGAPGEELDTAEIYADPMPRDSSSGFTRLTPHEETA